MFSLQFCWLGFVQTQMRSLVLVGSRLELLLLLALSQGDDAVRIERVEPVLVLELATGDDRGVQLAHCLRELHTHEDLAVRAT